MRTKYPSQRVHVCSLFVDNAKSVSKIDVPIHALTAGYKNCCYSVYSPNLNIVSLFNCSHFGEYNVIIVLIFLSIKTNDVKPLFMFVGNVDSLFCEVF